MSVDLSEKLVVGISSRALFNLEESHAIFESQGIESYQAHQTEHEKVCLEPGPAFHLIQKLLALRHPQTGDSLVEVILLSRNSADTGLRIFNSISAHKLAISRAAFTNGRNPYQYVSAFQADLFLSAHQEDVSQALEQNCAAAMFLKDRENANKSHEIRIAFDVNAILFSHSKDVRFKSGKFKKFLTTLHDIQKLFPEDACPIRTALVNHGQSSCQQVIVHLREWGIRTDEVLFLDGLVRHEFLDAFGADIFFNAEDS